MRELKADEMKKITTKLKNYLGDNIEDLLEDKVLRLNNMRVYLFNNALLKAASQLSRKQICSIGVTIGKFTKTNNFMLTITSLWEIFDHALNKVWIKDSAEMNYLYGNNAIKSHILKISDSFDSNKGIIVLNSRDVPLGFGLTAINADLYERKRGGEIVIINQADAGEYIRDETGIV